MRELKFRAWVYYGEKLKKPHYSQDYDNLTIFFEDHDENDGKQCIEQYTGLKDKNGKEICEGDIVLVANQGRTPYVVIYREGDCSFVCNNEFIVDYVHLFKGMPQCYEIIGNIHENPELLDVKEEG